MEYAKRAGNRLLNGIWSSISVICLIAVFATSSHGQGIPYHTDHRDLYAFLNDLRVLGCIDYNPSIKPLGRTQIARILQSADSCQALNPVLKKSLDFWWKEFGKDIGDGGRDRKPRNYNDPYLSGKKLRKRYDLVYYSSPLFQVTLNPILGGELNVSSSGNIQRYQWWGGEVFGRLGKNWGFYFNVRDHLETINWHSGENLSPNLGGVYRRSLADTGGVEYYEMRGGVTYSWKWGMIGIVKDHLQLGTTEHQEIILSKRAPSFPRLHLRVAPVKWVELNYTFGWLASGIVDSARSYITTGGAFREVYHNKFIAANTITVRPTKGLYFSLGSSVIIADDNVNIAHFIPIMFYNALDQGFNGQNNNAGQNSQVFADLSWDVFGYAQIYGSLFIDEIRIATMFSPDKQRNIVSYLAGIRSRPISRANLKLYAQYARVRPAVYNHYISTTTYDHAGYNLGHFLGENSDQIIVGLQLQPWMRWKFRLEWEEWRKGAAHIFGANAVDVTGLDFMSYKAAQRRSYTFSTQYSVVNDVVANIRINYVQGRTDGINGLPNVLKGNSDLLWFTFGLNIGL